MDREKSLSQKFYFVIAIFITVVCSPLELPEPIKGFLIRVHFKHVATFYRRFANFTKCFTNAISFFIVNG